ncbi:MAG: ammonium transporter [Thermoleophilia bacterium]|nr:ammonium transporter [Thermoleophilia bacterium]
MRVKKLGIASLLVLLAALVVPGLASAGLPADVAGNDLELSIVWVAFATVLVFLMQAGFMFLEIGFSRMKNAGTGVGKILINLAIVSIAWWAVGYGIGGFGDGALTDVAGTTGFFFHFDQMVGVGADAVPVTSDTVAFMLFGMSFCAVSLAVVWGTTLERIKFSSYVIYAVFFGALIYPMVAHSVYGGGLLSDIGGKPVMDFAGSSVVHLTGATGGFAALLLLGARKGKYGADGAPRAIPGHSMPLVGLGVIILWIGWFGFNGGSTLGTDGSFFSEVMLNTQLAAAAGVIGACLLIYAKTKTLDVGMAGNGAIAGLVGITAGCGYVEYWAAPIIGFISGLIVVVGVLAVEKWLDDPIGALSAHGMAGIFGTAAVGIFGSPRLVLDGAGSGIWYSIFGDQTFSSTFGQLGVQLLGSTAIFIFVFVFSYVIFAIIKATIGIRVSEEEEDAGLDISSHGMYGYPEAFIPQPEYPVGAYTPSMAGTPVAPLESTPPSDQA